MDSALEANSGHWDKLDLSLFDHLVEAGKNLKLFKQPAETSDLVLDVVLAERGANRSLY